MSYFYDSGAYGIGRRASMADTSGTTIWSYDGRGRVIKETKTVGSLNFVTKWEYNSADLVTRMTYPENATGGENGEAIDYTYNRQMGLDTVAGYTSYVPDTLYNAAGQVELRKLGGTAGSPVLQTDYSYFGWTIANGWGRLKRITTGTPGTPDSLQDLWYYSGTDTSRYDANGNLLNIYDYKAGGTQTQTFTYDNLDRLLSAAASGGTGGTYSENYSYSASTGNLSSKAGVSYTYGAQSGACPDGALSKPHAVVTAGSNTYCYDKNGNQVKRTIAGSVYNLSYNAENRLTGVSGATTATYVYDGDGNRVKATAGGVTTVYVGNYFEWSGSTSTMIKYYYAGAARVALRIGAGTGTTGLSWLLSDHPGSQAITADSSGTKTGELRYKAWGETRHTWGTTPTKRQYTGQLNETSVGLYFFNARWYDSALGRWSQPDSIIPLERQGVQAWDRYAFVNNNPLRFTDLTGNMVDDGDDGGDASRKRYSTLCIPGYNCPVPTPTPTLPLKVSAPTINSTATPSPTASPPIIGINTPTPPVTPTPYIITPEYTFDPQSIDLSSLFNTGINEFTKSFDLLNLDYDPLSAIGADWLTPFEGNPYTGPFVQPIRGALTVITTVAHFLDLFPNQYYPLLNRPVPPAP